MNKVSLKNATEISNQGGAVPSGDWVNGSGNYVTARPTPPFCVKVRVIGPLEFVIDNGKYGWEDPKLKAYAVNAAKRLLKKRPRVTKIILLNDKRGLNKALRDKGISA